jgi:type I restriction enzyme S subunit
MNPELLLAHFNRISDAPDAIPRLRLFILDLAIRGKLVEQDSDDAIASAEPVYIGRERREDVTSPYKIPSSWQFRDLRSISDQITDGEHATPPRIQEQQIPLVTAKNVRDGFMDFSKTDWVSFETATRAWRRCRPTAGDILLVCVGATTGRLCVLREPKDMVLVRSVALIRPSLISNVDYLALALRSPMVQSQIWKKVKVSAQPCLYINRMNSLSIPVPPVSEQRRIVAKVEELMGLCDQLEAAQRERKNRQDRLTHASHHHLNNGADTGGFRQHAHFFIGHIPQLTARPGQIDQLRQTILNLAVRGQLVPQDPNNEPASEFLKRTKAKKSDTQPFPIPGSWAWVTVDQIGQCRLGKMLDKTKNKGTPRRYLRNVNVRWFGFDLSDVFEMRFEDDELEEFVLRSGDVLICEGGEPGRAAVWDEREKNIYFQKAIHRVRFQGGVDSHFFVSAIRESADSGRLAGYFTGVGIKHFTGKGLSSFTFPLAPITEQHRIVAKVDELMALCDRLEGQLTTARAETSHLLESVLHHALSDDCSREELVKSAALK